MLLLFKSLEVAIQNTALSKYLPIQDISQIF